MVYSNSIIKANHFVVELLPNAKDGFLQALKSFNPSKNISRTLTESNITGIESINFTTTYENIVVRNNFSSEYICDLGNEFELIIGGSYSNYTVNLPFTVINKKEQWSLCCKINFTLHLSQLTESGLYIVIGIPLYNIQIVVNYNCITKDIAITLRLPVFDGNNDDRNAASSNGCNLKCLNVDFVKNKIDQRTFEKPSPVWTPRPYQLPNHFNVYDPVSNNQNQNPPLPPHGPLSNSPTTNIPGSISQRYPTYSNTPKIPPAIPARPNQQFPQRSASSSSQFNYSTQSNYSIQGGFGAQSHTSVSQYNSLPRISSRPQPRQTSPPPPYSSISSSNSAPNTPTIQSTPNNPNPNPNPTRTEPVRKGFDQLNVSVNKAMNEIDKIISKASNTISSFKKDNSNTSNTQQPQPQQQNQQQNISLKTN